MQLFGELFTPSLVHKFIVLLFFFRQRWNIGEGHIEYNDIFFKWGNRVASSVCTSGVYEEVRRGGKSWILETVSVRTISLTLHTYRRELKITSYFLQWRLRLCNVPSYYLHSVQLTKFHNKYWDNMPRSLFLFFFFLFSRSLSIENSFIHSIIYQTISSLQFFFCNVWQRSISMTLN